MGQKPFASSPLEIALIAVAPHSVTTESGSLRIVNAVGSILEPKIVRVDLDEHLLKGNPFFGVFHDFLVEEGCAVPLSLLPVLESEPARLAKVLAEPLLLLLNLFSNLLTVL